MLICNKCGYEKEHSGTYEDFECVLCTGKMETQSKSYICGHCEGNGYVGCVTDNKECKNCGGIGEVRMGKETIDKQSLADIICKDSMQQQIKKYGNNKLWQMLERNIVNAKSRLAYRKYFFNVGGYVKESEV